MKSSEKEITRRSMKKTTANPSNYSSYKAALLRKDAARFRDYIENTTTHGVVRIYRGPTWIRRFVWLCVVVTVISVLGYFLVQRAIRLSKYEKSTSFDIRQVPQLSFPAITVCNVNPIKDTYLEERNLTVYVLCLFFSSTPASNCSHLEPETSRDLTFRELYVEGGQTASEFLVENETFPSVATFLFDYIQLFNRCYTINSNGTITANNTRSRLDISLYLNNSQISREGASSFGALVAVHNPGSPAELSSALRVPAGFVGHIQLEYRTHSLLGSPYGPCKTEGLPLNYATDYSVSACRNEQTIKRMMDVCKCVPPVVLPAFLNRTRYPECTLSKLSCLAVSSDVSDLNLGNLCPQQCTGGSYTPKLSYTLSSSFRAPTIGDENTSAASFSSEVTVVVQFSSFSVTHVSERPSYLFGDFVSDVGGQMGLFIGASLVSLCELLVWLIDEFKDRILQAWRWFGWCPGSERPTLQGGGIGSAGLGEEDPGPAGSSKDSPVHSTVNSTSELKEYVIYSET